MHLYVFVLDKIETPLRTKINARWRLALVQIVEEGDCGGEEQAPATERL
jgi:hypothetical protein